MCTKFYVKTPKTDKVTKHSSKKISRFLTQATSVFEGEFSLNFTKTAILQLTHRR